MKTKQLTAEDYRASLPTRGNVGVAWTMETFSTYVNLLYPHITVAEGQVWTGNRAKYKSVCSVHGQYEARAGDLLTVKYGCQCLGCTTDKTTANAGIVRKPRATKEEKELAAKLRADGLNYKEIARQLGRSHATIQCWLKPECRERHRQRNAKWKSENRERNRANDRRYRSEFEHGRANQNAKSATRRLLKQNTPEFVFFDDEWHEVDRKQTYKVFKDYLLPPAERKAIQELFLEAQHQTETTGVEHHVDHIQPLSKGGEHSMLNLQILPADENMSKNNTFREEDQALIIQRLFN